MSIELAQEKIAEADALLITAGAGMGVDSGLPDFRGNEGFWRAYPPIKKLGISFSEMANPMWFDEDPALAWAFYGHRLNLYRDTVPHEGFGILRDLALSKKDFFIFTSNVDGQFQKAEFDDNKIYEVHGSIHHLQCSKNCTDAIWSASGTSIDIDMERFQAYDYPQCDHCGAVVRPNILMFGDWSWNERRSYEQRSRFDSFLNTVRTQNSKLVVIEIGAGEAVPTVRMLSEQAARRTDGFVIRLNPRDYTIDDSIGIGLSMGGLEGIEALTA
jgi:NAD-dependent SIR2 family protein deacetylase